MRTSRSLRIAAYMLAINAVVSLAAAVASAVDWESVRHPGWMTQGKALSLCAGMVVGYGCATLRLGFQKWANVLALCLAASGIGIASAPWLGTSALPWNLLLATLLIVGLTRSPRRTPATS